MYRSSTEWRAYFAKMYVGGTVRVQLEWLLDDLEAAEQAAAQGLAKDASRCGICNREKEACPYRGCPSCHDYLDTIDGVTNTNDPCCAPCHPCWEVREEVRTLAEAHDAPPLEA